MMKNAKAGFTLAEVLTTLMVIGVVAAMTIPTLMNSTQEQTAKTATKKAMSVLSQGAQLIVASDTNCSFNEDNPTSAELASCMKQVLAGEQTAGSEGNNRIKTNDGMEYEFIVPSDATGASLSTVCGTDFGQYNAANSCLVVVDVSAGKGSTIPTTASSFAYNKDTGLTKSPETDIDIVAFDFSAQGARPFGIAGQKTNNAFKYLYGTGKTVPELNFCCAMDKDTDGNYEDPEKCTSGDNSGKYICQSPSATTGECEDGYKDVTEAGFVASCE